MKVPIRVAWAACLVYTAYSSVNLALRKRSNQSKITAGQGLPTYIVDGDEGTCTKTFPAGQLTYPWFIVDLEAAYEISHVVIIKQPAYPLNPVQIELYGGSPIVCPGDKALCSYQSHTLSEVENITCQDNTIGRYFMIRSHQMLCEVKVYGQRVSAPHESTCAGIRVPKQLGSALAGGGAIPGEAKSRVGCANECMANGPCVAYSFNAVDGKCVYASALGEAYDQAGSDGWELYKLC